MAIDNSTSPKARGGSAPVRRRRAPIPAAVRNGMKTGHDLLRQIEVAIKKQIKEEGDFNIPAIARIFLDALPEKGSEQAIGFALTIGEYLASAADGALLYPDFKSLDTADWKEVRHGQG